MAGGQEAEPAICPVSGTAKIIFGHRGREGNNRSNGVCPVRAPLPIYRAYSNRAAQNESNHRYATDLVFYNALIALGWSGEGVVMCAVRKG